MVEDGEWLQLVHEAHAAAELLKTKPTNHQGRGDEHVAKRVEQLAAKGSWRRALAAATQVAHVQKSDEAIWKALKAELPSSSNLCPPCDEASVLDDDQRRKLRKLN